MDHFQNEAVKAWYVSSIPIFLYYTVLDATCVMAVSQVEEGQTPESPYRGKYPPSTEDFILSEN